MPTNKHNLLLNRTFQYLGIILVMAAMGGGYWYWKNAQAGLNVNTSQEGTLSNGLVGYWPFDGNDISGTTAYDRSGQGNNSTLTNGPTKVIGEVGQALSFNGTTQHVNVSSLFGNPTNVTLSAWVNQSSSNSGEIISVGNHIAIRSEANSNGISGFYYNGTTWLGTTSGKRVDGTGWHLVTYVMNDSADSQKIYVDGIEIKSSTNAASIVYTGLQSNTAIGVHSDLSQFRFSGFLDEPRIYNRALSASEIWSLYQSGKPDEVNTGASQADPLEKGMVGYWKLDDASGTSATDASGNGNTGTLTNGPTWTTGQIGGAVDFDGTDDYITASQTSTGLTQLTVSVWANPDQTLANQNGIFKWASAYNDGTPFILIAREAGTTNAQFYVDGNYRLNYPISNGSWSLISLTLDINNLWRFYVNGIYAGSFQDDGSHLNQGESSLFFGRTTLGGFDGKLDEVRIYNRALSAEEITKLYKTTAPDNPDTGLVGYWSFNGPDLSGTTAYDRSGKGNNGTLTNGPTVTPGRSGQALNFDGTNQYVTVPDSASLDIGTAATFSAWVKPTTTTFASGSTHVFRKWQFGAEDKALTLSNGGNIDFYLYNVFGGSALTATSKVSANVWTHIVGRYDGSVAEIYVNGVKVATKAASGDVADGTGALAIGYNPSGPSGYFPGQIDEPRIYNRALSASEIWDLYQLGNPDKVNSADSQGDSLEKGMVGYWKLDDGSGTSATDSSGNANTGTLTNGPTWTTGQIGGAVNFDGTNDEITTTNSISASNFTLSTWFKTPSSSGKKIVGFEDQQTGTGSGIYVDTIFVGTDGKLKFAWFAGGVQIISSANSYADNAWHHAVATHIASGTVALYVDGVLQGTGTGGVTFNNGYWRIGGYACIGVTDCSNGYFPGSIDEVRVYNRALSADEVTKLYKTTAPDDPDTGLVGYWSFNGPDLSGTTAYDRSGKGNNGTLTNGPTVTPGKAGQGLNFDGANDYVDIGNKTIIDGASAASVCFWMKYNPASVTADSAIVTKWVSGAPNGWLSWVDDVAIVGGNTNTVSFAVDSVASGLTGRVEGTSNLVTPGVWDHYCGTFQGSSFIRLYKNASLNAQSTSGIVSTVVSTSNPIYIANSADASLIKYANAGIDEVRIYNRALTQTEITALYNAGR